MIVTNEELTELLKFLSNQFVDRNSTRLYDGTVIYELMKRAEDYLKGNDNGIQDTKST